MKQQVGVYMLKHWVDQLKIIAKEESEKQDTHISYLDLIKMAVKEKYKFKECIKED